MPTLLLTAFGPWGEHRENASARWWREATLTAPAGWDLSFIELPVDWEAGPRLLETVMAEIGDLGAIVLTGLAAGRSAITPERWAHNRADPTATDIRGAALGRDTVRPDGPDRLAASLPVDRLVDALRAAAVPAAPSDDAGTYLCNGLSYRLLDQLAEARRAIPAGFIHVPPRECLIDAQWQAAAEIVVTCVTKAGTSETV